MTTTTQTQRGQCPACGRKIALRKDGTLRYHTVPRQWGTGRSGALLRRMGRAAVGRGADPMTTIVPSEVVKALNAAEERCHPTPWRTTWTPETALGAVAMRLGVAEVGIARVRLRQPRRGWWAPVTLPGLRTPELFVTYTDDAVIELLREAYARREQTP